VMVVNKKKEAVSQLETVFFMFKIWRFYWYFVYLVIDLQMIKYEFQALQPTANDTFTLFV